MRVLLAMLLLFAQPLRAESLTVFAASSLIDALKDIGKLWEGAGHRAIRFNFAASPVLARQIEQGAPVNIFASADLQWMEYAASKALIADGTRVNLLGNDLVLVMPKDRMRPIALAPGLDVAALLGADGRLATGDPANVPVGIYAQQALTKLGLWAKIEPRLARTENVRIALLLVERGEVPAGIVYATDAAIAPGVAIAGVFAENTHDPIAYPFAVTRAGDTAEARAFLLYLSGPEAKGVFRARGFRVN